MHHHNVARPMRLLAPFSGAVFFGYFCIGAFLPTLPLYLSKNGHPALIAGALVGAQPLATLLSRGIAGSLCDARGPKSSAVFGFIFLLGGGVLHLGAVGLHGATMLLVLALGRLVVGFGESVFITALSTWSIATVGSARAGRAMSWSGMAMYGALVLSAPISLSVESVGGFGLVSLGAMIAAGAGLVVVSILPVFDIAAAPATKARLSNVVGKIWDLGLALSLASIGVGTIAAFIFLRFETEHWAYANDAMLAFGVAFLGVRATLSGLPDRIDGRVLATICLSAEAAGQLTIFLAPNPLGGLVGVAVAGAGYALVFPALGVQAIDRVPIGNRGLVIAVYLGCFDLGLAISGPLAGLVTKLADVRYAFLSAGIAATGGALLSNAMPVFRSLARRSP